jgi:hypothetical protein
MITQLMKLGPQVVDTEAMDALNEIYSVVTKSNVTRLKASTRLASLLSYEDERDLKQRQKYETVIEEMKNVNQVSVRQEYYYLANDIFFLLIEFM